MAEESDEDLLGTLAGDAEVTDEDRESAREKAEELYTDEEGRHSGPLGGALREQELQADTARHLAAREDARRRRGVGLEDDRLFEHAEELYDISTGKRKSKGQIRAEEALQILTGAQRGVARGGTGFGAAARLRGGERGAQRSEVVGGAKIAESAELQRDVSKAQLDELLIQGKQRAENKALQMANLKFQQEQAEGNLFSDILGGIFGAIGGVVGFIGSGFNPAGAIVGAGVGSAVGEGAGDWLA